MSHHFAGVSLNGSLVVCLVALALALLAMSVGMKDVTSSAFAGSIHDGQPTAVINDLVAGHDRLLNEYTTRFVQRYPFFKPPMPPPPHHEPVVLPTPIETPASKPAGPPDHYTGPNVLWVIGDEVYFAMPAPTKIEKYMHLHAGEERNGVKVLGTDRLPASVHVAHAGGEYDVKVFGDGVAEDRLFEGMPAGRDASLDGLVPASQTP